MHIIIVYYVSVVVFNILHTIALVSLLNAVNAWKFVTAM